MSVHISHEEWASLLSGAEMPVCADGMTARSWAAKLHISEDRARRWVREGLDAGYMERVPIEFTDIAGRTMRGIGFRVKPREG